MIGTIERGKVYPLSEFKTLAGMSDAAVRSAKASAQTHGIALVVQIGKRAWVRGDDWWRFVGMLGKASIQ